MYLFVGKEKANHPVVTMCRVLGVSTSGYYAWRKRGRSIRSQRDEELTTVIREVHEGSRGTYGAPRVHAELVLGYGIGCSMKRVARLMRAAGIVGIHRRRRRGLTQRDPARPLYSDLVKREFMPKSPDKLWVADLTQHRTGEGWLYLGVVLDAFSRIVVGWAMGNRPITELTVDSATMAIVKRRPDSGLIHHSDHGSQYTAVAFRQALEEAGMRGSMGTVGDALDNAVAESFFATLQTELLDRQSWSTRLELRSSIFEYIEVFYNRQRRHSTLNYLSPVEYERRWQSTQQPVGLTMNAKPETVH